MSDRYRVARHHGAIYGRLTARKRFRCNGHLNPAGHWIEPGDWYIASALPPNDPDIGNTGWWHHRLCMECAPVEYTEAGGSDD